MTARNPRPPREPVPVEDGGNWRSLLEDAKHTLVRWQKYGIHGFLALVVLAGGYVTVDRRDLEEQRDEARKERDSARLELTQARVELALLRTRGEPGGRGALQPVYENVFIIGEGRIEDVGKLLELMGPVSRSP